MRLDNRPADRQPHTHAARFRREHWVEYPLDGARLEALPRVFHRDHHTSRVMDLGPYGQHPLPIRRGHGIDRVRDQIH